MTNFPAFEIPADLRQLAATSVEQARQAVGKVLEAAQYAVDQADKSPLPIPAPVKDLNSKALTYANANVKAAFDLADKLVHAKDPQEAASLQADFLKTQLAALQEQAKEFGSSAMTAMTPKA